VDDDDAVDYDAPVDDGPVDDELLDDPTRLIAADRPGLLRSLATAGAQVRELAALSAEAGVARLAAGAAPRSLVLVADPQAAATVDLLSALADRRDGCPVFALPLEPAAPGAPALPNWVGAADLVVVAGLTRSRESELALLADGAARRGAALLGVGRAGGSLEERCSWARAPYVAVPLERADGVASWALATPVLRLAGELGLLGPESGDALDELAAALDRMAELCRPDGESFLNPGKLLAQQLAGALPMVLADSAAMGMVARRFASALARLAGVPAAVAVLPGDAAEAAAYLTGPFAPGPAERDIFRDRVDETGPVLRLVVVREQQAPEGPAPTVLRELVRQAELTGLVSGELVAEESGRLPRMGALIALGEFAAAYLRLASGRGGTDLERYRA